MPESTCISSLDFLSMRSGRELLEWTGEWKKGTAAKPSSTPSESLATGALLDRAADMKTGALTMGLGIGALSIDRQADRPEQITNGFDGRGQSLEISQSLAHFARTGRSQSRGWIRSGV
jgi:hypothetical protein